MSNFHVITGSSAKKILEKSRADVVELIERTYILHDSGETTNPDSYFLRFPDRPDSRVIALPARLGGDVGRIGIKWISSFPRNTRSGLPRASAVLLLNDDETGAPVACLEAAGISAARTAASAALAARHLAAPRAQRVSFIGAGVIARTISDYLAVTVPGLREAVVHDLDAPSGRRLVEHVAAHHGWKSEPAESLEEALGADIVVFATTALRPYVPAGTRLRPDQLVLHVSLRDLAPEILLAANNVVDDVEHCLKAQTSPHLAEQLSGGRGFVNGTIGQVLRGRLTLDPGLPTVFSPFGLGVLDIALGDLVYREALGSGDAVGIEGFVGETTRW